MLAPTDRHGDYVVDDVVGHGGSATVYRAHHVSDPDAAVALKVLDARHTDDGHERRLRREFDFAGAVAHPHVVTMYASGPQWLAMQFLGGGPATRLSERRADVLAALGQIASALDHAHGLGVVHCDVKPSNILLHEAFSEGGAVLTDFGVARALTDHHDHDVTHIEASVPYSAPEVLRGRAPTAAADLYALACTAVELLTGATPFVGATSYEIADAHVHGPVPTYSRRIDWIPRAFDSILAKAMAKDPEARYETCGEFIAVVTRALSEP